MHCLKGRARHIIAFDVEGLVEPPNHKQHSRDDAIVENLGTSSLELELWFNHE